MEKLIEELCETLVAKCQSQRSSAESSPGGLSSSASSSKVAQYWIGVAAPPGTGKTTFCSKLASDLQRRGVMCTIVPMDGYHYSRAELDSMPDPKSAYRFRGAPFTFNAQAFVRDLHMAKEQGEFSFPGFDHAAGDPSPNTHFLSQDSQIVLVEGNYLLLDEEPWKSLSKPGLFNEMWYLQCPLVVAKQRLANRHMKAWGWSMSQALERIEDSDGKNMLLVESSPGISRASRVIDVNRPWGNDLQHL